MRRRSRDVVVEQGRGVRWDDTMGLDNDRDISSRFGKKEIAPCRCQLK